MDQGHFKYLIKFDDLSKEEAIAFNTILRNLFRRRGIDFRQYRPNCLRRRVIVGMHDANVETFSAYLGFLNRNPDKYDKLLDRITINVSEFFRNTDTFKVVNKQVLPAIIDLKKKRDDDKIRVWSAGCATGEEPYSLAIMLKETLTNLKLKFNITIFATDIDKEVIKKAEIGCYSRKALRALKDYQVKAYFSKKGEDQYYINPEFREMVKFRIHNMICDEPLPRIDLIFCRNVIIYFSRELQYKAYKNFYQSLIPQAFLVAGKTESLMDIKEELFEKFDLNERILRKIA